jgi:hypothetical protein
MNAVTWRNVALALIMVTLGAPLAPAAAYPEYQLFIQKQSGSPVNCGLCHVNSAGPEGSGDGQIGSLTPAELDRLGQARSAFKPGQKVDSPILNDFGDSIVSALGKLQIIEFRRSPEQLLKQLNPKSDLDQDGIPDREELLAGTHPLRDTSGNPWRLFQHNMLKYRFHLLMMLIATGAMLYGLRHLMRGFSAWKLFK